MSMLAVVGVLLDGGTSPGKSAAACRTNGIFRGTLRQCVLKFTIKCRNVSAATHDLSPTHRRQSARLSWHPSRNTSFCAQSRQVHCEPFEIGERAVGQSSLVSGAQGNAGGLAYLECFLPAGCT